MNKTLVIDLRVVGKWTAIGLLILGFAALIGLGTSAFWYWPTEVMQLQPVILADGQTAIEMTCRDVPGSYMQLFGMNQERVANYYSLDGGSEWLLEDFSGVTIDYLKDDLRSLHRKWLLEHKPQVLNAGVDAVTAD